MTSHSHARVQSADHVPAARDSHPGDQDQVREVRITFPKGFDKAKARQWVAEMRHRLEDSPSFDAVVVLNSGQVLAAEEAGTYLPAAPAAAMKGEARLVRWTEDGTLVDGQRIQDSWGVKRQTVDAARARGEIFSLWVRGQHWYPADVLRLERAAFAALNRALGALDPTTKLLFLLKPHGLLDGMSPAAAIEAGRGDEVLRLAASWADPD